MEDIGSQKGMFRTLAMENTNEGCQAVLRTLPLGPPPAVEQRVKVCNRAVLCRALEAKERRARVIGVTVLKPTAVGNNTNSLMVCHDCGSPNHLARYCLLSERPK